MQIIQNIRDKGAAIVIAVIALSLIGFIMMDAKQGGSNMLSGTSQTIGKINGVSIDASTFTDKITQLEDANGGRASGAQVYQIRQQAWDNIVGDLILTKELNKLGLIFTSKEFSDIVTSEDAPSSLKQAFSDKDGKYDVQKAKDWLLSLKKAKSEQRAATDAQIFEPLRLQTLYNRYSNLLSASAYYPTWMQEKENEENNQFATISIVNIPYNKVADSLAKVSDDDVIAYMKKHENIYKQDGGRKITYVTFNAGPNATDSAQAQEYVYKLKEAFAADTNAKIFFTKNTSSIPFKDTYVQASTLNAVVKDSLTKLPVGGVYGPYTEGTNYAIAKLLAVKSIPDSIKCRHILINFQQQGLSDSAGKARIDSIQAAVQSGADFGALVTQYSDDAGSKEKKGEYDFTFANDYPTLAKEFGEMVFFGSTGDKKVVKTEFGYHYIEVLSQKNFQNCYKIAYLGKEIIASEETVNAAKNKATKFSNEARDEKLFQQYVEKNGLTKIEVPNIIKENDYRVGQLGEARQLVKWAFEAKKGDVSEAMDMPGDVIVVGIVSDVVKEGIPDVKTGRQMVEVIVRNDKKAEIIKKKLGTTLESAAAAFPDVQVLTLGQDSSITFNSPYINTVGNEPKVTGAIFNKANQTKVSDPIVGENGVYVLKVNSIGNKPTPATPTLEEKVKSRTQQLARQIFGFFEYLKKAADIKDERSKLF